MNRIDALYFRARDAWRVLTQPGFIDGYLDDALITGRRVAYRNIRAKLDEHDPHQFENQHFKLGYYYAYEQAKAVMQSDEDYSLD